ncbi:hypothetical protein F4821DRAFT_206245 [Hypoxylon rubiginosum]|uniref:Uncharacterized protein n=1 Tax=Hypoxylon rubiginosum TaxID=110542 RepID=A0ACC0CQU6_9PEZI|nr:hypothetical protein F4821DRAFT_206245 [Hypoxylon rubiginosum]
MAPSQTELQPKCSSPVCKGGSATDLLLCSACKQARYCSKNCQKQDWSNHKTFCKHVSTNGASSKLLDSVAYHPKVAAHDPQARAIAREIGITLPISNSEFRGLNFPMRRLVVTGKDTPENLSLFFGQHNSVQEVHKNVRLEVLLRPPPGSPMYVLSTSTGADENCPSWTPREPSAAESVEIEEIRAMQEVIRSHMGARGVENISTNDMRDILVENFGNQWSAKLQTYQNAVNSMDQGVQV